jgi:VWFA-related protein
MSRALLCLFALAFGQEDAVFRTSVELIRVDVQVTDSDKPVMKLKREDFIVQDEGQVQEIVEFGLDNQELDLILVLDISSSMTVLLNQVKAQARTAFSSLNFRDRVGVVIFDNAPYLVIEPTWDWQAVETAIRGINVLGRGTELNQSVMLAAKYLRTKARPGARRGLIAFTDNIGYRGVSNSRVRDGLWESDVILSSVFFNPLMPETQNPRADLQIFVDATGGDVVRLKENNLNLAEVLTRMRQRYSILYKAPKRKPGSVCNITVRMSDPAKSHYRIRARSGYRAGIANSDSRQKMSLR